MFRKTYVDVLALHERNGKTRPIKILWEGGKVFTVERLLMRNKAKSVKVGGGNYRYTVQIKGRETFLFEEDGRWFVEEETEG